MKKIISKISKMIATLTLAALVVLADTNVTAATKTVKIGKATLLPGYVAGVKFHIKPLSGGGYAYCLNLHKKTASNVTQYYVNEQNAGMAYILENGYPHKKFTGNKNKDIYITQAAVWWYLDDTTGTSYLSKSFKSTGSDKYGLRKHIKKLVSGAKIAKSKGYSKPSLKAKVSTSNTTLSNDGKYYVSKSIDANAKNITGKYKVSISSAPSGTIITNTSGSKQNSFKANEKFLIKIPTSKVAEGKTATAKVKITASSTINKAYKYAPKNNSIQPVVVLQKYTKSVSDTISVKATKPTRRKTPPPKTPTPSKVKIIKLDQDTNTAVEGATLVVKDASGKEIARFTTTTTAYEINNIANGTYVVEEESAPNGYELSTKKESFTISNSVRNAEVKFYNKAKQSVISILKLDEDTNKPVEGAVLVIKDANGNEIKRFTSTVNGYSLTGLSNGAYTVEEVEAPNGYELSTKKETFTISDDTKVVEVKFYNKIKESQVSILKLDKNTNNQIAGAVLVVKDANGNEIKRFTSTVNGYSLTGLSNGTYTVEEVQAPEGYELSSEKETFTLDDSTKNIEVKFYNTPKDRVVTINKIDSTTGKPLAGAVIVVVDENGNEVVRFTSTNKAYTIKDLKDGTYTISEEEAPEGYFLNEDSQTFTIDNNHLSHQIIIKNIPKTCENGGLDEDECSVEVPNTSSNQTVFYILGITIMSLGVGYVYKHHKQG